jgi:hypothetical protein
MNQNHVKSSERGKEAERCLNDLLAGRQARRARWDVKKKRSTYVAGSVRVRLADKFVEEGLEAGDICRRVGSILLIRRVVRRSGPTWKGREILMIERKGGYGER